MNIPASIDSDNSSFAIREFLDAIQAQDQPNTASADFKLAVESVNSITDTFEVLPAIQMPGADPTSSTLFQAYLGVFASNPTTANLTDTAMSSEKQAQLKVMGVNATTAAGTFANGQPLQSNAFEPEFTDMESAQGTRFPTAAGAEDFSGFYDALMRGPGMNRQRIGTRLDLRG